MSITKAQNFCKFDRKPLHGVRQWDCLSFRPISSGAGRSRDTRQEALEGGTRTSAPGLHHLSLAGIFWVSCSCVSQAWLFIRLTHQRLVINRAVCSICRAPEKMKICNISNGQLESHSGVPWGAHVALLGSLNLSPAETMDCDSGIDGVSLSGRAPV